MHAARWSGGHRAARCVPAMLGGHDTGALLADVGMARIDWFRSLVFWSYRILAPELAES